MVGKTKKIKEDSIMSLTINTNVAALQAHNNLLNTDSALSSSMEKLSSGYRINNASDDAAGLSIANTLRSNISSLTVASQNTTEANAGLSIAQGAATQIESILERMKELATEAANGDGGTAENQEFTQLQAEITRIVASTPSAGGTFQVGDDASTASQITVAVTSMDLGTLGLTTTTVTGTANAQAAITAVTSAINTVDNNLAAIGAGQNRLTYAYNNLQTEIVNMSSQESAIRDVDMASEMTNFTKNQILEQAGTAMLAQANSSSQNILTLFK
jgi:flagellin